MGISDDTGKVAHATVDALKTQPLALALVIVNVLFLVGGAYIAHDFFARMESSSERKDQLLSDLASRCLYANPPAREDRP
jgi:hypothetical protein